MSNAQVKVGNLSLQYGEEIVDDKGKLVKIIGEQNNKIYALNLIGEDKYFIKVFNASNMKEIKKAQIKLPEYQDKDVDFEDIMLLKDKLYVLGSVYYGKEKEFTLVAYPVNENGDLLVGNEKILFKAEVAKKNARGNFYFKQSLDESKMLIMHTCKFNKEDAIKYEIKLFDSSLNTIMEDSEKVSYDDSKRRLNFRISDFDMNTQNDIFLVINESYLEEKKDVEKMYVHAFKSSNKYAKEKIDINFTNHGVINCKMLGTHNGLLQLVGFYSPVKENGKLKYGLDGVYSVSINTKTNTAGEVKFNDFDYNTKVKLMGERRAKKDKDVDPLYNITNIIEKEDGGLIMLSEYSTITQGGSVGIGPLAMTSTVITCNEVIVTSLKNDGSLDWANVLPKKQDVSIKTLHFFVGGYGLVNGSFAVGGGFQIAVPLLSRGPEYLSTIPIYKNNKLSILFNDNKNNVGVTDIEKIKDIGNYNNAVPTIFTFDEKGDFTRIDIEEAVKDQLIIRPLVYYRKTDSEYIIYGSRKASDKLGRLYID